MSSADQQGDNLDQVLIQNRGEGSFITPRETVLLFPTCGHLSERERVWRIPIGGAIFEPGVVNLRRRFLLRMLRRAMDVPAEAMESRIFRDRIGAFIAAAERGKKVTFHAGALTFALQRKTRRDGQFTGLLRLTSHDAARLEGLGQIANGWLDYDVAFPDSDRRLFGGRAQLLPSRGVSVISDIDDTIKHSGVWSRRALLANTFLREFQYVSGMAERYQRWAAEEVAFHYVSSSPWQLYGPLADLQRCAGFPEGTFHLRSFRLRDHMLRRMLLVRRHRKFAAIRRLLRTFPDRRFVLIGDSGERDPELYGEVARRFPRQVQAIYIRLVRGRKWTGERIERAFRRLAPTLWRSFEDSSELPDALRLID